MSEQEVKQRILMKAEEIFSGIGFTKTTMEEIADELGISKKTLYKHFTNKEHILKEIIKNAKCEVRDFVGSLVANQELEFFDKIKKIMEYFAERAPKMNTQMMRDIFKNHPEIWKEVHEEIEGKAQNHFSMLVEQGIQSGFIRNDINPELITMVYFGAIHNIYKTEMLAKLPVSTEQIPSYVAKIIFEGIYSDEGRQKCRETFLNKKITENNL
ncbi:MAG: TetR/AcrR family transcriptional regulator [Bacteroidota bacterium]